MRTFLAFILLAIVSAPVAIITTILTLPLWRWIESTFTIESVGHSGPAGWCYITSYIIILLCLYLIRHQIQPDKERS